MVCDKVRGSLKCWDSKDKGTQIATPFVQSRPPPPPYAVAVKEEDFPLSSLARLDEQLSRPKWVVPVRAGDDLELLLRAAIKLCKAGELPIRCGVGYEHSCVPPCSKCTFLLAANYYD